VPKYFPCILELLVVTHWSSIPLSYSRNNEGKRPLGRRGRRGGDNIKMKFQEIRVGGVGWIWSGTSDRDK